MMAYDIFMNKHSGFLKVTVKYFNSEVCFRGIRTDLTVKS